MTLSIHSLRRVLFPLAGAVLLLLARYLMIPGGGADAAWPSQKWAGVCLYAIVIVASVAGWGAWVRQWLRLPWEPVLYLPLGAAFVSFLCLWLGSFGAIGANVAPLWVLLLMVGLWKVPECTTWPRLSLPAGLFALALGMFVLIPQGHPDPFFYHLIGVREWYEAGRIYFNPDGPMSYRAGSWDMLYLFALQMDALGPGDNLAAQQVVAQLLHFGIGFLGSVGIFGKILERWGAQPAWTWFACGSLFLLEPAFCAKNDWGLILWLASALWLASEGHAVAFLLAGLGVAGKWSGAPALLIVIACAASAGSPAAWGARAGFFVLGVLPWMAHYWLRTGDPFFPMFASSTYGAPVAHMDKLFYSSVSGGAGGMRAAAAGLWGLWKSHPLNFLVLLFPFVWRTLKSSEKRFLAGTAAAVLLAAVAKHPALSWRLAGVVIPALAISGILVGHQLWGRKRLVTGKAVALALAVPWYLFLSQWHWPQLRHLFAQPAEVIRDFRCGHAMAWLRLQVSRDEPIAFSGTNELYYMLGWNAVSVDGSVRFDAVLRDSSGLTETVRILREKGFRWYAECADPNPRGVIAANFAMLSTLSAAREGGLVAFSGEHGRVWNLEKVQELTRRPGFTDPPVPRDSYLLEPQR